MFISLNSDGTAVMLLPEHVYQGSNVANVFVTAPFPNTTVLQVGFTLPNGTTASAPMTYVENSDGIWQYTIAAAITNEAGAASVSITATTTTGQVIASQSIPFTIEKTTLPVLPDTPSQDEYTLILQYIQQNSANIATLQGQISTIEADVATANDNASEAVSTANAAQTTAQTALTTANGLAASIAQANTNASEALSTANQAASAAASNATAIANIVNGTTTVAKADSANSATNATNATNDGNGNNIANTYATKTELSTGNADTLAAAQNYTNQALANYSIIEIVQTLPETGDTGKIYLVPKADSTSGDLYSEYLWNGTEWELVGTVSATSGTTIKVNGVSQIEVDFTSDPQTQITANSTAISNIVDGTTTVPNATKATQDGNGNVIATTYATVTALDSETSARQSADTTLQNNINAIVNGTTPAGDSDKLGGVVAESYAQLSQVVRTDSAQSLTDGQKQQAQQNLVIHNNARLSSAGWYRILKLNGRGIYEISLNKTYINTVPIPTKIFVSYGWRDYNGYFITSIGGGDRAVTKVRLSKDSSQNVYVDIYYDYQLAEIVSYTASGYSLLDTFTNFEAVDFTAVSGDITELVSIDLLKGINTTGGLYQNGAPVLAVDPTTLTPSTDNGWTQGTASSKLPSAGVYLMVIKPTASWSTAVFIMFYNGSGTGGAATVDTTYGQPVSVVLNSAGFSISATGDSFTIEKVWFKKI